MIHNIIIITGVVMILVGILTSLFTKTQTISSIPKPLEYDAENIPIDGVGFCWRTSPILDSNGNMFLRRLQPCMKNIFFALTGDTITVHRVSSSTVKLIMTRGAFNDFKKQEIGRTKYDGDFDVESCTVLPYIKFLFVIPKYIKKYHKSLVLSGNEQIVKDVIT